MRKKCTFQSLGSKQSMIGYYCSTAPTDYTSVSDEPLTFTRRSLSQSVTITIRDDTTVEDSEKFVARLSVNASLYPGVRLAPDTANVIIAPDGKTIQNYCNVKGYIWPPRCIVYMIGKW